MFCFETAINMLYWSALVYDYKQVGLCSAAPCSGWPDEGLLLLMRLMASAQRPVLRAWHLHTPVRPKDGWLERIWLLHSCLALAAIACRCR